MKFWYAAAICTVLAGCDESALQNLAVSNAPEVEPEVSFGPTVPAVSSISGVTAAQLPQARFQGPALDMTWQSRFQPGVAYVNQSLLPIPIYSGPDAQDQIARLRLGNGGAINACAVEVNMCSITFGTARNQGWVFMDKMGVVGTEPATPS